MKHILITTIAAVVLAGCGESQQSTPTPEAKTVKPAAEATDHSGTYTLSIDDSTFTIELKPDGSFIGTPQGEEDDRVIGSWKDEGNLLVCEGTQKSSPKKIVLKLKTTLELTSMTVDGEDRRPPVPVGADGHYFKQSAPSPETASVEPVVEAPKVEPPTVEELLNSIGTPLNEMEKIISDEKYLEKLVGDSSAPSETINRANHTYSILYIFEEDRTLVHGVWMIKDDTFYYMELVSNDIQIPEEEREVLSANIISLKKDKSQLSIPPIDENEKESRIILTAIDEFKEKEMKSFNNEQVNKNFNIFEKSR